MIRIISALTALQTLAAPLRSRLRSDRGLEAVEYALLAALVAVTIIAAAALLDVGIRDAFTDIQNKLMNPG